MIAIGRDLSHYLILMHLHAKTAFLCQRCWCSLLPLAGWLLLSQILLLLQHQNLRVANLKADTHLNKSISKTGLVLTSRMTHYVKLEHITNCRTSLHLLASPRPAACLVVHPPCSSRYLRVDWVAACSLCIWSGWKK